MWTVPEVGSGRSTSRVISALTDHMPGGSSAVIA